MHSAGSGNPILPLQEPPGHRLNTVTSLSYYDKHMLGYTVSMSVGVVADRGCGIGFERGCGSECNMYI